MCVESFLSPLIFVLFLLLLLVVCESWMQI